MVKSFFATREWALWAWGGLALILASTSAQVYMTVLLNTWYRDFYDLLGAATENDIADFWTTIKRFYQIALTYVTVATFTGFFTRHWTFRWRQAMTFYYIPKWSANEKDIEGSSQRIQEDTEGFADILSSLGIELFESTLTVIAFIAILWGLSEHVELPYLQDIPGSLVWLILLLSFGSLLISFGVGIKLPGLHYNNQKVEAAFRKKLVYGEDNKEHAVVPALVELFWPVRFNYFRLYLHLAYFDIWKILYLQSIVLVPFIAMAPSLFSGAITQGIVFQVANAFGKVNDGFSYPIRYWTIITKFMSIIKRLKEFELALGIRTEGKQTASAVQRI